MYPDCEAKPIDVACFDRLEGVIDAVYNPLCTNLVLDAKAKGIKAEGGLYMLVMQAVVAVERFLDTAVEREAADRVFASVFGAKENIVLTGMPGSGKSTVGRLLKPEGFTFVDTDAEIEKRCGCAIGDLIREKGEKYFRDLETEVIREVASEGGRVISTGGGAVLREENVRCLKQNGRLFFLQRNLNLLPTDGRPLSQANPLGKMYETRLPLYRSFADREIDNNGAPEATAARILEAFHEIFDR
jgi:shikimate dehydrogenase